MVHGIDPGITAGAFPDHITLGPDGNLWFTEFGIDRIGRITPLGVVTEFSAGISAGAGLFDITPGPDGNLWFTELTGNRIGRITTSGSGGSAPTTSAVVSSLNPSLVGQSVTFTATVTGNSPTGTVQFKDGAGNLGAPVSVERRQRLVHHGLAGGWNAFDHGGVQRRCQ